MYEGEHWSKNPWVWLIIAIPALTVLGCALTIYLAVSRPYTLVSDPTAVTSVSPETQQFGSE